MPCLHTCAFACREGTSMAVACGLLHSPGGHQVQPMMAALSSGPLQQRPDESLCSHVYR